MDSDDSVAPRGSRARLALGLGLAMAMVLGVVLLLWSPSGSRSAPAVVAAPEATDPGGPTADPPGDEVSAEHTIETEDRSATTMAVVDTGPVVVELVDTSRATVRGGVVLDGVRRLPTTVWHPETPGPHPLIVFAHGYQVGPMTYARFCAALAARGYVVAAPSFPLADASRGNGLDRDDIGNQAVDVDFVISSLRATDAAIDDGPVAVIGHSDGATVALLVAERPAVMHPAVGAVVAIAPDAVEGPFTNTPPPVLIIHGTDDPIAAFADSQGDLARFRGARWLLALEGADHLPPIVGGTPWTPVLDEAVEVFLAATLPAGVGIDPVGLTSALEQLELSHVLTSG